MIIRQFLQWARTAPLNERAEAAAALARAYLFSPLRPSEKTAAERALMLLVEDPAPLVRRALARVLGSAAEAPPDVILALAADCPEVASIVLEQSPLLAEGDLIALIASENAELQAAIARRNGLGRALAAAVAEVGSAQACLVLIENPSAELGSASLQRIADRFGQLGAVREALFARADLPAATRQALLTSLADKLQLLVVRRHWLDHHHAARVRQQACEKATVALAGGSRAGELPDLVRQLRATGQLTVALLIRALLCGNLLFLEQALAELSGVPLWRVSALIRDRGGIGLGALCEKAGLTRGGLQAVRAVLEVWHEARAAGEPSGTTRLSGPMLDRALRRCEQEPSAEFKPLLRLLRTFATEVAREEAQLLCPLLAAA